MNKATKMFPFLLICALSFYISPLVVNDTGGFIILLLIVLPLICFVVSLIYALTNEFVPWQIVFPIVVGILFVPSIYIFYNSSAWIYTIAYVAISLVGNGVGYGIAKIFKRSK